MYFLSLFVSATHYWINLECLLILIRTKTTMFYKWTFNLLAEVLMMVETGLDTVTTPPTTTTTLTTTFIRR